MEEIGGSWNIPWQAYVPDVVNGTGGSAGGALEQFMTNMFGFLTILAGLMFIIYFSLGGLRWITSGGDAGKKDEARTQLTNAGIGLIVVVATYSITFIIGQVLGLNILNPAQTIESVLGGGGSGSSVYEGYETPYNLSE